MRSAPDPPPYPPPQGGRGLYYFLKHGRFDRLMLAAQPQQPIPPPPLRGRVGGARQPRRAAMMPRPLPLALAATLLWLLAATAAYAQTDEIQVYNGDINAPGEFSVTLHNNYTPIGRKEPAFPGAIVPDHAWNGVPEYAYGVKDWLQLGIYLPPYSGTPHGRFLLHRRNFPVLFPLPHPRAPTSFYPVTF